jgi:hypothetical protein
VPQPGGGEISVADRVTLTDIYRGPIPLCIAALMPRGTYGTGTRAGWVLASCKMVPEIKGIGTVTFNWELGGVGADSAWLPVDDFAMDIMELNPKVERNMYFVGATHPLRGGADPDDKISTDTITLCYKAVHGSSDTEREQAKSKIAGLTTAQCDWGQALLDMLSNGCDTFYQVGVKYSHVQFCFTLPAMLIGGQLEASPTGPMAVELAGIGMQWLRMADKADPIGVNGSFFKFTKSWLGAAGGHWDSRLYYVAA